MPRNKKQDASEAPPAAAAPAPPNAAADAFTKIEPEFATLTSEEFAPLPPDPGAAVNLVLSAVPRIQEHRAAMLEYLPKHPIGFVDKLDSYAQAAWYTHLLHTYANNSPEASKAIVDEASRLREGLLIAAEALAHRNLLDADSVAKIRKSADLASDLTALATLFKDSWGKVSSKTAVERHEIERAAELGPAVLVALHAKTHVASKPVDTEVQRARAFTLLSRAYDGCRQALAYLRWAEGDAEAIAPSLVKKRPGRKAGAKKDEESGAEEVAEAG